MTKLPVASATMLAAFDNCPHKGFRMYIAKDLVKDTDAKRDWGNTLHKAFAMFISRGRSLPKEGQKYERILQPLRAHKPLTELPLAIDRDGKPCGFFDTKVFCRGYGDVVVIHGSTAIILDWKSGKKREDPFELRLHGFMLKASHPELDRIIGHYVWLKLIEMGLNPIGQKHDLSDTMAMQRELEAQMDEIEYMLLNNHFPKTPNPLCSWCPVLDCEHNSNEELKNAHQVRIA